MGTLGENTERDWSQPERSYDIPSTEGLDGVKLGINGAGGVIGQATIERVVRTLGPQALGALNDPGSDPDTLAYLLRRRSGLQGHPIKAVEEAGKHALVFGETPVPLMGYRNPQEIPWQYHGVVGPDGEGGLVIDASGFFKNKASAGKHLIGMNPGSRVLISAPPDGEVDNVVTYGVNHHSLQSDQEVVSAASCTTMAAATLLKAVREVIAEEGAEVLYLHLLTVHGYTMDQSLQPNARQKKLTRSRPVQGNTIPTSTGAANALKKVLPDLQINLAGFADRVNQADVSQILLNMVLSDPIALDVLHAGLRTRVNRLLAFDDDQRVSSDFKGDTHSVTYDPSVASAGGFQLRTERGGSLHVGGWYDNVDAYVARLVDTAFLMLRQMKEA